MSCGPEVRSRSCSNLGLFCQLQRILDVCAKIPDRVLDLGVTQQDLNCTEVPGRLVDDRGLSAPERVGAIVLPPEPNRCHPFIDEASILARAQVAGVLNSAREGIVVD